MSAKAKKRGSSRIRDPLMRWFVLTGAITVQLILGTVYGYSIFWTPLEARVYPPIITTAERDAQVAGGADVTGLTVVADNQEKQKLSDERQGKLKYAFAICILSFALTMVVAGRIQDVTGPRLPAVVGAVLMGMGFVLAGLMTNPIVFHLAHAVLIGAVSLVLLMLFHARFGHLDHQEYPILKYAPLAIVATVVVLGIALANDYVGKSGEYDELFLLWATVGLLAGAGIGFAYVCPIAALIKWFPKHKGLVSGLAVAGFGFGAYLFSLKGWEFGAVGFIDKHGIRTFFLVHAAVCFVAVTLGAMLLRNPPGTPAKVAGESDWRETLRQPSFYLLWLMFFSGALAGLMVIGIVKVFAGEQLVGAQQAAGVAMTAEATKDLMMKGAAAVGYLAIFNALGRIIWGLLSDRIGRTTAFVAMFCFQAVMMFLLAGMKTEVSIAIAASIVGFNFGGNFALFPSATADLFGAKNLGANYGWVFTSYGIAGVVGIAAGNTAKAMTGSYFAAFALAGCLCVLSAVLAVVLRVKQQRAAAAAAAAASE